MASPDTIILLIVDYRAVIWGSKTPSSPPLAYTPSCRHRITMQVYDDTRLQNTVQCPTSTQAVFSVMRHEGKFLSLCRFVQITQ